MTIEEVAERADAWSEAIKKILKAISAAGVALAAAISALLMWWPSGGEEPDTAGTAHNVPSYTTLLNTTGLNNNGQCGKN